MRLEAARQTYTDSSMGLLLWLESLSISAWVRESPSLWAQPTILTLHTMGLGVMVGVSWVLDLRLLGISRNIPLSSFRWVFSAATVGLIVNLVTGVLLFAQRATALGTAIPFFIKMGLVIASVATLVPLRSLVFRSVPGVEESEVSGRVRLLAIVSILVWSASIAAGRLLAYLVP
jgi:hypothetical protein